MKLFFAFFLVICSTTFSSAAEQSSAVYDGAVIREDVTWRGSILVRGSVVVAPQATLRIEPGTVIRFASVSARHLSNLVVQGRLHAAGTAGQPITFTSGNSAPSRSDWGGIVLLATEKKNQLEHCRIEYAQSGIDVRFSSIHLKAVSIVQARTALLSHDSSVQMAACSVMDSDTGIEIYNSEFDARDATISSCRRGGVFHTSAVTLSAPKISNNLQSGLEVVDCRIKISGGDISGNVRGASITGGEGQLLTTSFLRNEQVALHLVGSRLKVQRCLFADNSQDALRTEDGFALLLNNAFSSNGGFNIYHAGRDAVSARQNWWGTTELKKISQKIHDAVDDKNAGIVNVFPWLEEKPPLMP